MPSLKQFVRDVTKAVPSPGGGSVYEVWKEQKSKRGQEDNPDEHLREPAAPQNDVAVGDLGSGSDYTAFLQHLGVPSTDVSSLGPYGVYHSVFDDFAWFKKFGDPTFIYEQEMARVYGVELLRMADADVLPYDYENYGREMNEQEREYFDLPPAPPLTIHQRLKRIRSRLEGRVKQQN